VRWTEPAQLPELQMHRSMRMRLTRYDHYLATGQQHLG
jgi:hypothetical protein